MLSQRYEGWGPGREWGGGEGVHKFGGFLRTHRPPRSHK